ncbi:heptosyltransferase, partial [Desulfovibrio sp. OttesenSCG-928-C14]|nr:heptosyltransferase [Desulfovibrio sp. OttesenSCG-928-C14]
PNGLLGLVSGLDELGAVYRVVDGMEDEKTARLRQEKREFLREYLLGDGGSAGGNPEGLVAEKDWILPDYF